MACRARRVVEILPKAALTLALWLAAAGCGTTERTACDGFADRKLAITSAEYRACAGEILAALDAIEPPLRAIVFDSTPRDNDRQAARGAYAKLRTRIRRTGMESDFWGTSSTIMIKWPDAAVSAFNSAAHKAAVQYKAVLDYPNADNFGQGVQAHQDAERWYRAMQ